MVKLIDKPKILQVATSGITFKALLLPLVDRLEAEGYEVHITCSDSKQTRELVDRGYRVTPILIERKIAPISNLKSLWRLYRFMRRERFDAVHVHTPIAAVVGRLAAWMAGVQVIIYTAHGFYFHDRMSAKARMVVLGLEKLLGRITHMLLTQSSEDAATAVDEGICPKERVRWIGNGVDVASFIHVGDSNGVGGYERWEGLAEGDRVVGFVGRMVGEKGIGELIDAMDMVIRDVPEAKLMLVGDTLDDDRDSGFKEVLSRKINKNGLAPRVLFTGFVDDVPKAMASMDLYVLPSHREGMPRTIIEAMASGKPVVATDIRGCREEVVEGVTGHLVPVNDPVALADAIKKVITRPDICREMGEAGRRRAIEHFDEGAVVDREIKVYRELMGARLGESV
ncbi:MAG: glycosyltransferase family 4 protein [Chloroflexi bacterium]|nr:glycosyltransferase family 4 protein [Chloroflexota bacterium]